MKLKDVERKKKVNWENEENSSELVKPKVQVMSLR
jgi:hypothetical protein